MGEMEVEDPGIPVNDIADNPTKLEEKAKNESGEDVVLDSDWTDVKQFESCQNVRAILLRKQDPPGGVARIEGSPSRYILTAKVTGVILLAAKPGEKIILLGYPSVRCFRRRP
ncbi:hypothetical protein OAory_01000890 [Aspergillus oryzae]|uniref:Uncharacterized protein n=1 Tax=Aspergillus oryzae TaxID=5062 RepID=A0A1S9DTL5_ASPOZ|nr:hypothetical protein OAory_01000890 [Aspergillus oryzae]